jgi:hypothetical protein
LLFALLSLRGMTSIPGLSLAPTTAYAQGMQIFALDLSNDVLDEVGGAGDEDEQEDEEDNLNK